MNSHNHGNCLILYTNAERQNLGEVSHYCCGYSPTAGVSHSAYWPHCDYYCQHCSTIWLSARRTFLFNYRPLINLPFDVVKTSCFTCRTPDDLDLPIDLALLPRSILTQLFLHGQRTPKP